VTRIVSLCTGYGALDAAAAEVFGGHLIAVADTEPGPARLLAHRYPDVPNVGDITEVDWQEVMPTPAAVDVVTAGWP
jgi:DNA (cytosine-5)-methyltransferase 1